MIDFARKYIVAHRWQLAKFAFVGVVTFGINFLMFHVFYGLAHRDYRISVSLAYALTVICHFVLHRYFTFNAAGQQLIHNGSKYIAMLGLNYGMTVTVVWVVVAIMGSSPYFGVIASTAATACTSFLMMKYFVFGSKGILWVSS
jgi:putative flippase GtrA